MGRRLLLDGLLGAHGADEDAVARLQTPPEVVGLGEEQPVSRVKRSMGVDGGRSGRDQAPFGAEARGESEPRSEALGGPGQDLLGRPPLEPAAPRPLISSA